MIYQTLVTRGTLGASALAKHCNLARSSVYTALNTLTGKGLVATTHQNEVKQFVVTDTEALERMLHVQQKQLEQKFTSLEKLSHDLQNRTTSQIGEQSITFFQGIEGLQKVYLQMLREAPQNGVLRLLRDEFVWTKDWEFIFSDEWQRRVERLKRERNITTKLLVNDSEIEREKEQLYTHNLYIEYKKLPKEHAVQHYAWYILGNTTAVMSFEKNNMVGIQIINENMTENYKNVFEGLWGK